MQIDLENYQYHEGIKLKKPYEIQIKRANELRHVREDSCNETLTTQVGGNHYSKLAIQPVEYINANHLTYLQGNVIKYVTRYKDKNGLQDLQKARHYIDMLIELEEK